MGSEMCIRDSPNMAQSLRTQTPPLLPMNRLLAARAIRPLTEDHTAVLQETSTLATGIRGIEPHSILIGRACPGVQGITMYRRQNETKIA